MYKNLHPLKMFFCAVYVVRASDFVGKVRIKSVYVFADENEQNDFAHQTGCSRYKVYCATPYKYLSGQKFPYKSV